MAKMRTWLLENEVTTEAELNEIEEQAKKITNKARLEAWRAFMDSMKADHDNALALIQAVSAESNHSATINALYKELFGTQNPIRSDAVRTIRKVLRIVSGEHIPSKTALKTWYHEILTKARADYSSHLHSETSDSAMLISEVKPTYADDSPWIDGREVVQANFDYILSHNPLVFAIGEDVGKIGDVNQGFAGLQEKHGVLRVTDTGIREATIIGQGIGAALRGLRPIVEIQYLDYIFYALQILSDDLACLHYRTKGGQKCPLIIRTRGHRLEGIWHSGSPIGSLLHSQRGIYILVPRNMTQAAGFYNTLLKSEEPAMIIECLNGYRLKEQLPENIGQFTVPLGVPEIIREGADVTIVTYGSMCRIAVEGAQQLAEIGIEAEVIDVQSLLPFDIHHTIVKSIQKTNRVIFADEDVPGGATAFMLQQVLEVQNAYQWLDAKPVTITAEAHRPPYGSDGDYFSKPNPENIFDAVYAMMHEADPERFEEVY
jgi:pyruvate/2-oxoglutarate/acetoin dehydrogenase E1 component